MIDAIDKNCGLNNFSSLKRIVLFPFWFVAYAGYLCVFLLAGLSSAVYYYFYDLRINRIAEKDI